jgi:hypothetical protein
MKRLLLITGFVILGVFGLLVAINKFVGVTGNSHGEGHGPITSSESEKPQMKNQIQWSDEERQALDNIALSYDEVRKAEAVLSSKTLETLTSADLQSVVQAFEQALSLAESVPDGVLEKLNPEMKIQFRQIYQAGLLRMLNGFKNADQNSAKEGAELYQRYGAWVSTHTQELSFPTK